MERTIVDKLNFVKECICRGEYTLALDVVEEINQQKNLSVQEIFTSKILKSKILNQFGLFEEGLEIADQIYHKSQGLELPKITFGAMVVLAESLNNLGKLERSQQIIAEGETLQKSLAINETDDDELVELAAGLLNQKGELLKKKGALQQALELFEESHRLFQETNNQFEIAITLTNLGVTYALTGDLEEAMSYVAQSLAIYQQFDNRHKIAIAFHNFGDICRQKGFLEQALGHFKKSLPIWREIGKKEAIAASLLNIGMIYHNQGHFAKAFKHLELSLKLQKEIGNPLEIAYVLFQLITLTLDSNEEDKSELFFKELEQLNNQTQHKPTSQLYRLAQALMLKESARLRNLFKAIELLEEVTNEEISDHEITVFALLNLCELYFNELKLSGEMAVLADLRKIVGRLTNIASAQKSHKLYAQSYWLMAQLCLVDFDIDEAQNLLTKAQVLAEEREFKTLAMRISNDYDSLLQKMDEWEALIQRKASLSERLELAQLEDFVVQMIRRGITKATDLPEEKPVMIIILEQEGTTIYSKKFIPDQEIDDVLISGLLTALNNFIQEAFSTSGSFERIKHKEYTLLFKPLENINFCYVFQGPSYSAVQKLESFVDKIQQEPSLWEIFEQFIQTGIRPPSANFPIINEMVEEIFS
ncbi:MAG: tetratricopeptide repeat protein [Candidatus Heimdallarchaeota archaeon]|nr:tetratricopeptide repeat protein [Candidatus Heimdallarchaeota archaeon]